MGKLRRGRLASLGSAIGLILSRDVAVLLNAIAFNFLLCLFPLLLVVTAFAQQLPAGRRGTAALLLVVQELIPFDHKALADSLLGLTRMARSTQLLSLFLIVWGSSGIFMPVEMALNRAWGGRPKRDFWKSKILAFAMTVMGGVLALLSTMLTVTARGYSREWPTLAGYAVKASALSVTWLLFFLIYRLIPDAPIGSRVAARAAVLAAIAWEAAKYVFVWNLPRMNLKAVYGPLAFSVGLILWAYVSSLVLVLAALLSPIDDRKAR